MLATFACLNGSLRGILIMSYYNVTHMYLPNNRFSFHFTSKSPLSFVEFWPRDVIGSLPVATRRWFEIVGVRPKSARAANQFVLCQLVTLGVYDYWQKFGVVTIENFAGKSTQMGPLL